MKRREKNQQPACVVRLDRLSFTGIGSSKVPKKIGGFRMLRDFRPRTQGKVVTYGRVRTFCGTSNSALLSLQYKPVLPWLAPWRFTLIADDEDGLSPDEVESVIAQCSSHKPSMVELAFDFDQHSVVNRRFVLQHGRFGKTQRRKDRGGSGNLRYGSRRSPKLVRAYVKVGLGAFRVELEIHSGLLRKFGISSGYELGRLAAKLVPVHLQFLGFRWDSLRAYLIRKFGPLDGGQILEEVRDRAESSLHNATRYLTHRGVPNTHRFLGPLRANRRIRTALRRWAKKFLVNEESSLHIK
jgi:hypothetical protein